ncbi:DNA ligase I [Lanmaoa asiatica]|nr:DNA ligase I [Lanmaoa asiatica]
MTPCQLGYIMLVTRTRVAAYTHLMNRQQTLRASLLAHDHNRSFTPYQTGKFFEMPKNVKPSPPQQSSLAEMWGAGKKKRKVDQSSSTVLVSENDEQKKVASGEGRDRAVPSSPDYTKRRRVADSDEEVAPKPPAEGKSLPSRKPPSRTAVASSAESRIPPRSPVVKGKGKSKVQSAAPEDNEELSSSAAEGEEEDAAEDALQSEEEDATQNAEEALSRTGEVDIEGGWKVGAPCVAFTCKTWKRHFNGLLRVPYAALTKTFALIEATTKRLEKTSLLTSFFLLVVRRSAKGDTHSLLQAVYLCINKLSPDYVGVELGIGESLLIKAISESTGRSLAVVKADLKKEGDLGLVASATSQKTLFKPKSLTVAFVFTNLKEIALSSGHSSQAKKVSIITKLLAACQDSEAKYIIRSLEGKLRIGNAERTVLVALAHAAVLAENEESGKKWSKDKLTSRLEEAASIMKSVFSELPSYDLVIPALLTHGIDNLRSTCKLTPGVPLKPMLAKPTKAIGEVLDRFESKRFTCEYKYDGERAQVHKLGDGVVGVFSRNSEDMSKKYPDLVEQLPHCIKPETKSFVFDAEAVAIDKTTGTLMPFQELSKRKRKDVKIEDIQVRVCLFAFDLLYLNGESLLQRPLAERRELLRQHFQVVPGEFGFARSSDGDTTEEIQAFLEESVKDGCEGLMVKMLESDESHYEPSRRSVNWLKLKKDYLAGVGDSLDLIVVGGYYGKGKRTNVYGAFLLACFDAESEEYQTICKIGTGFSEEMLQTHWDTLRALEMEKPRGDIKVGGAKPDVWFEPKVVWEVLAADLSLSPIYTAAQGLVEERGISLRFPRFIRMRDDKLADDATGPEQIAEMYERQALAHRKGKNDKGGDGDDGFW